VLASLVSAMAMFGLAMQPASIDQAALFWWLLPPAIAVAFSDVAIDALMIERAQPSGWTGQMQSVQWTCLYAAGALAGLGGGYLSEHKYLRVGYLIVAGGALFSLTLSLLAGEDRRLTARATDEKMADHLLVAWRLPVLRAACLFLLLWSFNPFLSTTVLHVHMRNELKFSEQFFGETVTWNQLSAMAGTAVYGVIRSRVRDVRWLLHGAIVLGIISTIAYWALYDETSARTASVAAGFSGAMALLVQLDLAAQVCPLAIAGTVFSVLMALSNLSTFSSEWLGGVLYERWRLAWGAATAFNLLIAVGAATTALCWLLVPWLAREINDHPSRT
jgi:BT1 family protein